MHKPYYCARIVVVFLVFVILIFPEVAKAQKLVVGWSAVSALNSPYWVIKDAGFAKQEGLDADLIYIPSSSTMAQAQLAGNVLFLPLTARSSWTRASRAVTWSPWGR